MWTETIEGRKFIQEVSKSIVVQIAPEELDLFDDLVSEYLQDPTPPDLTTAAKDDPLGFGLAETLVAITPAAMAIVNIVLNHLMTESVKAAQEESTEVIKKKIRALFNPEKKDDRSADRLETDLPPLTKEQMEHVRKLARKQAIAFGIAPAKASQMVDALVGSLALA
jgi:hypothetical protein